jgi:hypothetical protein
MMRRWIFLRRYLISLGILALAPLAANAHDHTPQTARIIVQTPTANCRVELDDAAIGSTDSSGTLTRDNIEPEDHYLHVHCPGSPEAVYFISPRAGAETRINAAKAPVAPPVDEDPTATAEREGRLQQLVQQAVQYRNQAQLDEAVAALRQAMALDQENSDLHREMGITYLLAKDWKRARVEMIEAIRLDRTDADAHNGLGYALEKLGDLDGAVSEYRIATRLEPDDTSYRTHYYDALVKIQARKEAAK